MNLEYVEIKNIEANLNGTIKNKLSQISQNDQYRIQDREYFVQVVSKNISLQNYSKAFRIKKNVIRNNINMILANNCVQTNNQPNYSKVLGEGCFGEVALTTVSVQNDKIVYDNRGSTKVVVKALKNGGTSTNLDEKFYDYLSNIAKEVRAGQCLYNIFNYDLDGAKYSKIEERMIYRDRYMTDVLLDINEPYRMLDAVGIIDCQYYTPPGSAQFKVPGTNINENSVFFLAMPVMEGDMEKFFFGNPQNYFQKNPGVFYDTVEFRITMCFKMTQALKNIHEMGFINKDLKPENFLYKVHETVGNQYNIVLSIADFGLAGIDDYNTYQYSDLSYRPFDNYTLMSKELDVYQLGVSMFQVLFNIPRQHKPGLISLNLLNYFVVPETMAQLLKGPYSGEWNLIQGLGLNSQKTYCIKELVTRLYDKLRTYEYPNKDWKYSFNYFFYEMENVRSDMYHPDTFINVTSQTGFKIAVRSFFIANFMNVEECHQYQDVERIMGYAIRQAVHPDPTIRASSLSLFEDLKYDMRNIDQFSGVGREYINY